MSHLLFYFIWTVRMEIRVFFPASWNPQESQLPITIFNFLLFYFNVRKLNDVGGFILFYLYIRNSFPSVFKCWIYYILLQYQCISILHRLIHLRMTIMSGRKAAKMLCTQPHDHPCQESDVEWFSTVYPVIHHGMETLLITLRSYGSSSSTRLIKFLSP